MHAHVHIHTQRESDLTQLNCWLSGLCKVGIGTGRQEENRQIGSEQANRKRKMYVKRGRARKPWSSQGQSEIPVSSHSHGSWWDECPADSEAPHDGARHTCLAQELEEEDPGGGAAAGGLAPASHWQDHPACKQQCAWATKIPSKSHTRLSSTALPNQKHIGRGILGNTIEAHVWYFSLFQQNFKKVDIVIKTPENHLEKAACVFGRLRFISPWVPHPRIIS